MKRFLSFLFVLFVSIYQKIISPFFFAKCRYFPTCSNYAIEAVQKHGPFKGLFLTIKRIFRCHPWSRDGYDPVP